MREVGFETGAEGEGAEWEGRVGEEEEEVGGGGGVVDWGGGVSLCSVDVGRGEERPLFETVGWEGKAREAASVTAFNLSCASSSFRFSSAISSSISCGCTASLPTLLTLLSAMNALGNRESMLVMSSVLGSLSQSLSRKDRLSYVGPCANVGYLELTRPLVWVVDLTR